MHIETIASALPEGFQTLRAEAAAEGFIHVDRLWDEWQDGSNRFTRPGEQLLAARHESELAGIGGITVDYTVTDGLRMRRFYIRRAFRRAGAGRLLAEALLDHARPYGKDIALFAPYPGAAAFWEAMGFAPDACAEHSHILRAR